MSDNKKYYYIRLKDSFFDSNEIVLLESMPDGYLYSNILLKLYLRSLKDNGKLMFNDRIPYNAQMIATITRHQVGTVEKALSIFQEMGLIEILDNGAIYMLDIQNYIGKSSTEADRKRIYRNEIGCELIENGTNVRELSGQTTTRDRDRDIDRDINKKEKNIKKKKETNVPLVILPLQDDEEYEVYEQEVNEWKKTYEDIDVDKEFQLMRAWILSNPTRKKTSRGIKRFINNWLSGAKPSKKDIIPVYSSENNVNVSDEDISKYLGENDEL